MPCARKSRAFYPRKIVDVVLGFEAGSLPTRNQPVFIHKAKESKRLVDNGFGANNLAALAEPAAQRRKDRRDLPRL